MISAYALGVLVGAPCIAVLAARPSRRTLLMLLMSVFALASGLSALAPTYPRMLLCRFLSGLPHGAYFGISSLVLALYPLAAPHLVWLLRDVLASGIGGALGTVRQTRLMDVAGKAPGLGAALDHSAFNAANALGPWFGGMAIAVTP